MDIAPTPWHRGGDGSPQWAVYDVSGWYVAGADARHGRYTPEQIENHARLIVAAPAMRTLTERVAALDPDVDSADEVQWKLAQLVAEARAITGEPS